MGQAYCSVLTTVPHMLFRSQGNLDGGFDCFTCDKLSTGSLGEGVRPSG